MKTESLSRLITALGRPSVSNTYAAQSATQSGTNRRVQDSDAVSLAKGFGQSGSQVESARKQEKLELLKAQVQSGSYASNSEVVSVALIKDLGI